uniref:Uncharacterized protein n=1 Tax=Solanum tuberosum TaxID=4113 RepID=M1CX17_SOLTU
MADCRSQKAQKGVIYLLYTLVYSKKYGLQVAKYEDTSLMIRHKSIAIVQGKNAEIRTQTRSIYSDIRKGYTQIFP